VHASDFYAHFDFGVGSGECGVESGNLVFKLNSFLPPDIAIFDIFPVADNAHARFDAIARTYQYHVSDRRLPFRQGQYCRIYYRPDIERMNEAARVLMEYEDFTSFAKLHTQVKTNICHLTKAEWTEEADGWGFTIRSNRFLRNMVRAVVGTLIEVGRGRLSLDDFKKVIEGKQRSDAGESMPGNALFLEDIVY
jgi:tRNA pseudouridine38-40 synthase